MCISHHLHIQYLCSFLSSTSLFAQIRKSKRIQLHFVACNLFKVLLVVLIDGFIPRDANGVDLDRVESLSTQYRIPNLKPESTRNTILGENPSPKPNLMINRETMDYINQNPKMS